MESKGYVLYWEALSGAIAPQVMLEEMQIDYDTVAVDMAKGEHLGPAYLEINPTGQVPAVRLPDGAVIGESAAIVLVLGERHPKAGLVPAADEPDRADFLRWLLFMATSVYMTVVRFNHPERFTLDPSGIEHVRDAALQSLDRSFGILNEAVSGAPYFLPRGYSALDIYLSMCLVWHPNPDELFDDNPKIGALCRAVNRRPAYAGVLAQHC